MTDDSPALRTTGRRAVVVADGGVPSRGALDEAWPGWDDGVDLVVAADGGLGGAERLGLRVDRWVGDADSVDPAALRALERAGIPIERVQAAKDESDTELAVVVAVREGAGDVTILGALGGPRLDHALANVALLAHPSLRDRPARLLDAGARVSLVTAPDVSGRPVRRSLAGRIGDVVSLLAISADVIGVTTHGLRYPLVDEPLPAGPARGLSNVRDRSDASVEVGSGRLLVVEVPVTLSR